MALATVAVSVTTVPAVAADDEGESEAVVATVSTVSGTVDE